MNSEKVLDIIENELYYVGVDLTRDEELRVREHEEESLLYIKNVLAEYEKIKDKETPRKAIEFIDFDDIYCVCPKCHGLIFTMCANYCVHCGQKLEWEEGEE